MFTFPEKLQIDETAVTSAYLAGKSANEIGKDFNCSGTSICRILKKLGIKTTRNNNRIYKPKLHGKEQQAIKLYLDGSTLESIAKTFGCSIQAVETVLNLNHIERRKRGDSLKNTRSTNKWGRKFNARQSQEIVKFYTDDNSIAETGKKFGASNSCIEKILKEQGIILRNSADATRLAYKKKRAANPLNLSVLTIKELRNTPEYREWRLAVYRRDNFSCVTCGAAAKRNEVIIHADHIKPMSLFPELQFDINNGRTLCWECHKKTDSYGKKINRLKNTSTTVAAQTSAHL